jgi:hypothetical protein
VGVLEGDLYILDRELGIGNKEVGKVRFVRQAGNHPLHRNTSALDE